MKKGWEYKTLGECCEILDRFRKPIKQSKRESGRIPYYGATGLLDYVNDYIFDDTLVLLNNILLYEILKKNDEGIINEKLSKAMKGRPFTEEHRNALRGKRDSITLNKNPKARRVRCITTGKEFDCIKEAAEFYGIERRGISSCCRGKIKTSGKLNDGTKLKWEYIN